jgi:hypothetical protein
MLTCKAGKWKWYHHFYLFFLYYQAFFSYLNMIIKILRDDDQICQLTPSFGGVCLKAF